MVYTTIAWSPAAWQGSGKHSHVQAAGNAVPWKCSFLSYEQLKRICPACQPFLNISFFSPQVIIGCSCPHPEVPKRSSCEQSPEASGSPYLVEILLCFDNCQFTLWPWINSTSLIFILTCLTEGKDHSQVSILQLPNMFLIYLLYNILNINI